MGAAPALADSGGAGVTPAPAPAQGQAPAKGPAPGRARRPLYDAIRAVRAPTATAPRRARACGSAGATSAPPPWSSSTASAALATTSRPRPPRRRRAGRSRPCPQGARSGPVALIDLAGTPLAALGRVAGRGAATAARHLSPGRDARARSRPRSPSRASSSTARRSGPFSPTGSQSAMDLQVNLVRVTDNVGRACLAAADSHAGRAQSRALDRRDQGTRPAGRASTRSCCRRAALLPQASAPRATSRQRRSRCTTTCSRCAEHTTSAAAGRISAPGRSGHSHQGQDVFAACGTPLVVARGGTVQFAGFHSAAGYYVVIDGKGTGTDYAYMHLREKADVVRRRPRVHRTGAGRGRRDGQCPGLPPPLRGVDRARAGTTAGARSIRCRTSSAGTGRASHVAAPPRREA